MLENLPYINHNGKLVTGSAALVHRIFNKDDDHDRQAELREYKRLIQQLRYAKFEDDTI